MLEQTREQTADRAQTERRVRSFKEKFGTILLDTMEEYFPDQTRARRQRSAARAFAVGIVVGALLRHVVSR